MHHRIFFGVETIWSQKRNHRYAMIKGGQERVVKADKGR